MVRTCVTWDVLLVLARLSLFDHLVGAQKNGCRHIEAEGLRSLEIDHDLELGRQHDRQVRGLLALENSPGVDASPVESILLARPVANPTRPDVPSGTRPNDIRSRRSVFRQSHARSAHGPL